MLEKNTIKNNKLMLGLEVVGNTKDRERCSNVIEVGQKYKLSRQEKTEKK